MDRIQSITLRRPVLGRLVLLWLTLLVVARPGSLWAQIAPGGTTSAAAATDTLYAPVRVEGRRIFDVTGGNGLSAVDRADRINRRLQNLIAREETVEPFAPTDVVVREGQTTILLGGDPIMTVSGNDAEDAVSTPRELALVWGAKLSRAVIDARTARAHPLHGIGILIHNSFRDMLVSAVGWLPRLVGAALLWILFWLLTRLAYTVVESLGGRTHLDPNLRQLARAVARYGTWAIGFATILSLFGFNGSSILTAFGISGFVLGFAFKDILSHFLAGLMLLIGRQLRIGDQIVVNQYEGTVERIELRALYLRTYDNRLVIIPNSDVFTSVVTSNTASPLRRRDFLVHIGYESDIELARRVAVQAVLETENVLKDPPPDALVDELGTSTVALRVRFSASSLRAEYVKVESECMRRVKDALEQAGIALPSSATTIQIQNPVDLVETVWKTPPTPLHAAQNGKKDGDG